MSGRDVYPQLRRFSDAGNDAVTVRYGGRHPKAPRHECEFP